MAKKISLGNQFKVYGFKESLVADINAEITDGYTVKEIYTIAHTRSETNAHTISLKENELVELVFEDQTTWFGDHTMIAEFLADDVVSRSEIGIPELPDFISTDVESRGFFNRLKIKLLRIFFKKTIKESITAIATKLEDHFLNKRRGLYRLGRNFEFLPFTTPPPDKPILLLIHGTAASTDESFRDLRGTSLWFDIFSKFEFEVYCYEHMTLVKGPFENTEDLLGLLPENSSISLITTSRGGYIGELLVRFTESKNGFSDDEVEIFKKAGRHDDVKRIESIRILARQKNIKIEKFIRIACAAQGTSLLSKRLDFFLNTLINLLIPISGPLAPVIGIIKVLIGAVLEEKNNPEVLPGLEVQNPDSIFIKLLNSPDLESGTMRGFENRLIVIAGNARFSLNLRGLATILLNLVFRDAKNDMMVNTESMYQGAIRDKRVLYFLDEGNDVSHFNYFKNKKTQDAIRQAIISDGVVVPGFLERERRLQIADSRGAFGFPGGRLKSGKISGKKPIIILLPGIMGSTLENEEDFIWLNISRIAFGAVRRLRISEENINASAVIKSAYKDLYDYLSVKYDVLIFPFDWRESVTDAATKLNSAIGELFVFKQQIQIIAHSMGGLVVRELMIHHSETWKTLNSQEKFVFMMLGTPWMGSYRIPFLLAGEDQIIRVIDSLDFSHSREELIDMFVRYPGLLNLLPLQGAIDFSQVSEWTELQQYSTYAWLIPFAEEMQRFNVFKNAVLSQEAAFNYSKIIYIAGKADETVDGYAIVNDALKFEFTSEGDASVTWKLGIPKYLNHETSLYYVDVAHGDLANEGSLFRGITEILETGKTEQPEFSRKPKAEKVRKSSRSIGLVQSGTSPENLESSLLGLSGRVPDTVQQAPILKVSISYGDLLHSSYPILIGHFSKDGLLNAEYVADKYLKSALSRKHSLGIYPGRIGTGDFFESDNDNFFNGCIIIGLGEMEQLSANQLMITTEKSVSNYLLTHAMKKFEDAKSRGDSNDSVNKIGLSSLIIGANYGSLSMENSIRAIMKGIVNANLKVMAVTGIPDLYVDHLEFVELFEDRAIQCFMSLDRLIKGNSDNLTLIWNKPRIKRLLGARRRLIEQDTSDWWQRLSVLQRDTGVLSFYSATNTSREEQQDIYNNSALIEEMIESISLKDRWSQDSAKAIFNLLIPADFKENISRNSHILWVLDKDTAAFPWELLQTGGDHDKPLCIGAGMIRQLAIAEYKSVNSSVNSENILIVGDPDLAGFTRARQLDGAKEEAEEVARLFQSYALNMETPLIRSNHNEIIRCLFKKEYKILHLSGHGIFDPLNSRNSGMLIGKKKDLDEPILLTPEDIEQLPQPPEFVFINCCHLGRVHPFAEELSSSRNKLAANIGTELIRIGVKAVVVAGWEVDDEAAKEFAICFYNEMLENNKTFGAAVLEARKRVYSRYPYTNTWGAFQCYGDPHFKLDIERTISSSSAPVIKSERLVQQLENDLDKILSSCEITYYKHDWLFAQLEDLYKEISGSGEPAFYLREKLFKAYLELGRYNSAISVFQSLLDSMNPKYDLRSFETYLNILTKEILADKTKDDSVRISEIEQAIQNLEQINKVTNSFSGFMRVGSMYRRLAVLHPTAAKRIKELDHSIANYAKAWEISHYNSMYAFSNLAISNFSKSKLSGKPWEPLIGKERKSISLKKTIELLSDHIQKMSGDASDFWTMTTGPSLELSLLILKNGTGVENDIVSLFHSAWRKAGSPNKRIIQHDAVDTISSLIRKISSAAKLVKQLDAISLELKGYKQVF